MRYTNEGVTAADKAQWPSFTGQSDAALKGGEIVKKTMRELNYTLCRDRHHQPLVMLNSPLGNGQEISPASLRRLAGELLAIAAEAEAKAMDKSYVPVTKTTAF